MKHFRNEFRKNFNTTFYSIYLAMFFITSIFVNIASDLTSSQMGAWSYAYVCSSKFMPLLVIMCIINIINIFTVDYRHNTWKNLLCTGTHKNTIQFAKIGLSFISSIALLLFTYLLSFIIGLLLYGFDPHEEISSKVSLFDFGQDDITSGAFEIFGKSFINNLVLLLFFITFVMLIAEIFRGSKHVTLITIILYFVSNFIKTIIDIIILIDSKYIFLIILPFKHLDPDNRAFTTPEMVTSNCILLTYSVIFFVIAISLFKKRDIPTSK